MTRPWLVIDVSNLAFRAFHSTGGLRHGDAPTGIVFGLLRELSKLAKAFDSTDFVFCFDSDTSARKQSYPGYKAKRFDASQGKVRAECEKLRGDYLPALGLTNLFRQGGYEADDLIASAVANTPDGGSVVIVSSDEDLYQLLEDGVSVYKAQSKRRYGEDDLKREWGVRPDQWPVAKAIAGCTSDSVKGVGGVGLKTACQFLRGELNPTHKAWEKIEDWVENNVQYETNLKLVTLPFAGSMPVRPVRQGEIEPEAWKKLMDRLGIKVIDRPTAREAKGILG